MIPKYQVFISSTYEDLAKERQAVIKAILEMGHIPVGMEMFSAADERQWEMITRHIDQSDYYIILVAHKYGTMFDDVSYFEKEYDYAVEKGIPVLGFIINDNAPWSATMMEDNLAKKELLSQFKAKVRSKPVSFWSDSKELSLVVAVALGKEIHRQPRPGWIRATNFNDLDVTREVSRLSAENANLRNIIKSAQAKRKADDEAAIASAIALLRKNSVPIKVRLEGKDTFDEHASVSLMEVFEILAPELNTEATSQKLAYLLAIHVVENVVVSEAPWPIPSNYMASYLADLAVLELVEPSKTKHGKNDPGSYWTMSKFGRTVLKQMRLKVLEAGKADSSNEKVVKEQESTPIANSKPGSGAEAR